MVGRWVWVEDYGTATAWPVRSPTEATPSVFDRGAPGFMTNRLFAYPPSLERNLLDLRDGLRRLVRGAFNEWPPFGFADQFARALKKCPPALRLILIPLLKALFRSRPRRANVYQCALDGPIPLIRQRSRCRANRHKPGGTFNFRKIEGTA